MTLSRLVLGSLPMDERNLLSLHVDECATCRELTAALTRESVDGSKPPQESSITAANMRYVLKEELVRGGMGRILRARDRSLDRDVAIKCLREDRGDLERFTKEIQILSKLSHPAIVPMYDSGWLAEGFPFFAMPLLEGQSLDKRLDTTLTMNERLALIRTLMSVVGAVAYAHGQGILHRDIKPQNIFLGKFDECILLDWGLAKAKSTTEARGGKNLAVGNVAGVTRDGHGVGTVGYSAPEQLRGLGADERADVYGLGAVLYHVLAGTPPKAGQLVHLREVSPQIPPDLATLVMRAVEFDADARYASAQELSLELNRFFSGLMITAHNYSTKEKIVRFVKAHRAAVVVALVAILALAISVGLSMQRIAKQRDVALAERSRALEERRNTQKLASFVLVDVQERFDELGRLDLAEELAGEVSKFLQNSPAQSYSDLPVADRAADLVQKGRLHDLLGDVAKFRLRFPEALQHYQISNASYEQAAQLGTNLSVALCRSSSRVGDAFREMGDLHAAKTWYLKCQNMVSPADSENAASGTGWEEWNDVISSNQASLGDIMQLQKDWVGALAAYQKALTMLEPERPRTSPSFKRRAVFQHIAVSDRIATSYLEKGEVTQAKPYLQKNLAIARDFVAQTHGSANAKTTLIAALVHMASMDYYFEGGSQVEVLANEADQIAQQLRIADPSNLDIARHQTTIWRLLAEHSTDPAKSIPLLRKVVAQNRQQKAESPNSLYAQSTLAGDILALSDALAAAKQFPEAEALCEEASQLQRNALMAEPQAHLENDMLIVLLHCAEIDSVRKRHDLALQKAEEAVSLSKIALQIDNSPNNRYWEVIALTHWMGWLPTTQAAEKIPELVAAKQALAADPTNASNQATIHEADQLLAILQTKSR